MVKDRTDKTKIANWIEGDTFALKIENSSEEYNGRYLIFNRCDIDFWDKSRTVLPFRVKLTTEKKIPKNQEEIEAFPYVITSYLAYEERFFPIDSEKNVEEEIIEKKNRKYFPNEYGYLNIYIFNINIYKYKIPEEFKYIGNFLIKKPYDEFIPSSRFDRTQYYFFEDLTLEIPKLFERFNLRKDINYKKKGCKAYHEFAITNIKINLEAQRKVKLLTPQEEKFILQEIYSDNDFIKNLK